MKIVVLTTQTLHHAYFIREINKRFPLEAAVIETKGSKPPFETYHLFEDKRTAYEKEVFFRGGEALISDIIPTKDVDSVRDPDTLKYLIEVGPDVIVVFGTGKVPENIIARFRERIVNLHGGNPQEYRGLDSHLWAIYHKDFDGLVVTLHKVNKELDDGELIAQGAIAVTPEMKIYELRSYNTKACVELVILALKGFKSNGRFISEPQRKIGRYYSFMPVALKDVCVSNFEKYTESLIGNTEKIVA